MPFCLIGHAPPLRLVITRPSSNPPALDNYDIALTLVNIFGILAPEGMTGRTMFTGRMVHEVPCIGGSEKLTLHPTSRETI